MRKKHKGRQFVQGFGVVPMLGVISWSFQLWEEVLSRSGGWRFI